MGGSMTTQEQLDVAISRPEALCADILSGDAVSEVDTGEISEVGAPSPVIVGMAPEGHIFLVLPPGEVVSGSMAAAAAAEVERLAADRRLPMLLVLTGVEAVTKGARSVFSAAESMDAVAVLGVSPVDRVIANFLLGGSVQPCPTRYFSTEAAALSWLERKRSVA